MSISRRKVPYGFTLDQDSAVNFAEATAPTCCFIDQRPGQGHGAVGTWMDELGSECGEWPLLTAYLEMIAHVMETGEALDNHVPRIDPPGDLSWRARVTEPPPAAGTHPGRQLVL
ncbi:hypothetical protein [Streptomyces sp. BA2]|uniref:hypothetical protein n=1 Tax=Streptomyces sp. BA2 TaxID=436595 RepID=UPI0013218831|nr:hypothetical protein [Streptomyces sp. BA2]MWA08285.1 hypothetical protein [Streptomyces sp. BA2]